MLLGVHVSVRRGFPQALEEAELLGCKALQIFPRPPQTPELDLSEEEIRSFISKRKEKALGPVLVHSLYQPNIASTQSKISARSYESLVGELRVANLLGADALIIHSGNYSPDSTLKAGIARSAQAIRSAIHVTRSRAKVVIENVAGGARRMGGKFEELRDLMEKVGLPEKVGICLDTAHAYGAGWPLETAAGMDDWIAEFDKVIGIKRLAAFHMNDTLAERGSYKDIHEHIGKGFIGTEPLKKLVQDPRFAEIPGIIEVPRALREQHQKNLELLRN